MGSRRAPHDRRDGHRPVNHTPTPVDTRFESVASHPSCTPGALAAIRQYGGRTHRTRPRAPIENGHAAITILAGATTRAVNPLVGGDMSNRVGAPDGSRYQD